MNLLTYELINDLKYSADFSELQDVTDKACAMKQRGLISKHDYVMLCNLYSVRLAELYAEDLKKRFEENYNIYF